jgi:hypothetical protein
VVARCRLLQSCERHAAAPHWPLLLGVRATVSAAEATIYSIDVIEFCALTICKRDVLSCCHGRQLDVLTAASCSAAIGQLSTGVRALALLGAVLHGIGTDSNAALSTCVLPQRSKKQKHAVAGLCWRALTALF